MRNFTKGLAKIKINIVKLTTVASCFEYGTEPPDSMKGEKFID
jgi:hypothetical protein